MSGLQHTINFLVFNSLNHDELWSFVRNSTVSPLQNEGSRVPEIQYRWLIVSEFAEDSKTELSNRLGVSFLIKLVALIAVAMTPRHGN